MIEIDFNGVTSCLLYKSGSHAYTLEYSKSQDFYNSFILIFMKFKLL